MSNVGIEATKILCDLVPRSNCLLTESNNHRNIKCIVSKKVNFVEIEDEVKVGPT